MVLLLEASWKYLLVFPAAHNKLAFFFLSFFTVQDLVSEFRNHRNGFKLCTLGMNRFASLNPAQYRTAKRKNKRN